MMPAPRASSGAGPIRLQQRAPATRVGAHLAGCSRQLRRPQGAHAARSGIAVALFGGGAVDDGGGNKPAQSAVADPAQAGHPAISDPPAAPAPQCRTALRHAAIADVAWLDVQREPVATACCRYRSPNRFLAMSWTWAWPVVLALGLVWDVTAAKAPGLGRVLRCWRSYPCASRYTPPMQVA